jgi:DNA-binding transcriptional MocR family regulator
VAQRLQRHGIAVTPDEILLTNGSQQGIDLLLRMMAAPGRSAAVESPTYDFMLPLLRLNGLKPIEIPLRPDGMDLDVLERTLRGDRPVLVYTMPSFQNPTGVCTSQAHRERLLGLCETHRIPILEDGFEEEMKYTGKVVLPVKSMDRHRIVVYCGTFSKVLFPGVRIGWVAADRDCVERLTAIRRFGECAPSTVLQAAMHEFCRDGSYDRHVSRMHCVFRRRMHATLRALREHIRPEWAQWTEPRGGYLIWLQLKRLPAPAADVDALLASHGVRAALGRFFFSSEKPDRYLRLSISNLSEEEIAEGVNRLARALREAYAREPSRNARRGGHR